LLQRLLQDATWLVTDIDVIMQLASMRGIFG